MNFDHFLHQSDHFRVVGWISFGNQRFGPIGRIDDRSLMTECIEGILAVIGAETACSDTSEWQRRRSDLEDDIVDARRTGTGRIDDALGSTLVGREDVQRQGFVSGIDEANRVGFALSCDEGKERPEDFLLHDCIVFIDIRPAKKREKGCTIDGLHTASGTYMIVGAM